MILMDDHGFVRWSQKETRERKSCKTTKKNLINKDIGRIYFGRRIIRLRRITGNKCKSIIRLIRIMHLFSASKRRTKQTQSSSKTKIRQGKPETYKTDELNKPLVTSRRTVGGLVAINWRQSERNLVLDSRVFSFFCFLNKRCFCVVSRASFHFISVLFAAF